MVNKLKGYFDSKDDQKNLALQLHYHSKIPIQGYAMEKGTSSPLDGNLIYWATRTGKNPLIPTIKANFIKEQKGKCGLCRKYFLPRELIERDHIVPKALSRLNRRDNVDGVDNYCHSQKTKIDLSKIHRKRRSVT